MDIKEEKKAIKNLKAHLMDEWELTEEQKDEFDNLVFRVLSVGKEEAKAQAVPEGFVLVPKEPTYEMLEAGSEARSRTEGHIASIWEAMIETQEQIHV